MNSRRPSEGLQIQYRSEAFAAEPIAHTRDSFQFLDSAPKRLTLYERKNYEEGFRTGEADRQGQWHSDYQGSYAYRDANYGYSGYYLAQDDYNYYFREGFRRGYEDGYSSRHEYGRYSNGSYSMLDAIVSKSSTCSRFDRETTTTKRPPPIAETRLGVGLRGESRQECPILARPTVPLKRDNG